MMKRFIYTMIFLVGIILFTKNNIFADNNYDTCMEMLKNSTACGYIATNNYAVQFKYTGDHGSIAYYKESRKIGDVNELLGETNFSSFPDKVKELQGHGNKPFIRMGKDNGKDIYTIYYYASYGDFTKCKPNEKPILIQKSDDKGYVAKNGEDGWFCAEDYTKKDENEKPEERKYYAPTETVYDETAMCYEEMEPYPDGHYDCPATENPNTKCPCGYKDHKIRDAIGYAENNTKILYGCFSDPKLADDYFDEHIKDALAPSAPNTGPTSMGKPGVFADFWKYALNFFNPTDEKDASTNDNIDSLMTTIVDGFVMPLAYVALAILIIIQGVKFLFAATADKKTEYKESLLVLVISGVLILSGKQLFEAFRNVIVLGDTVTATTDIIFGMLLAIVQVVAFAAIIFAGLKYMSASSSQKADMKSSLIVLFVGAFLVFAAPFVFEIIKMIAEAITGGTPSS